MYDLGVEIIEELHGVLQVPHEEFLILYIRPVLLRHSKS